ncbi:hypothetical protein EGW08_013244 [Elysia chlorotica]|uniref:Uncharacterized protein n=1 Tax=Elysia chlorotica TaxID=188477 RepID=A0A3S0ZHG2_ELYCH|nr:hypothetical protein EGW08_013244 [Elysia chlorotica]
MATPNINYFKEKLVLREEEKSLKEMLAKFQDQLNRLKIEELALLSHIKLQQEKCAGVGPGNVQSRPGLRKSRDTPSEGGSSVSSAIPVGVMQYKKQAKHAGEEELDLAVTRHSHLGLDQDFGEEEEEEEEEEEDDEEEGEGLNDDDNPLLSYMDTA